MPPRKRPTGNNATLRVVEPTELLPPRKSSKMRPHRKPSATPISDTFILEKQRLVDIETGQLTDEYEEVWVPPDHDRCQAIIRSAGNVRRGNRCTRPHIKGGRVCYQHGGSLPGVRKAAAKRLAVAALPAAEELIRIALKKRHVSDGDRIRACLAILDRAGVQGKTTIEVELKPWQEMLSQIAGTLPGNADDSVIELEEGKDYWLPEDDNVEDEEENDG